MGLRWRDDVAETVMQRRFPGPGSALRFHANENPYPPPDAVVEAIQSAALRANRYPFGDEGLLVEQLAERCGVAPSQVLLGAGSNELLYHLISSLGGPGREAVFPSPSYPTFSAACLNSSVTAVPVSLRPDGACDLQAMGASVTDSTSVVVVCQPNNPTGATVGASELALFADGLTTEVLLLVDEAYFEYTEEHARSGSGALALLAGDRPVVVTRTFSKFYGLAGVRVGYAVASTSSLADEVRAHIGPSGLSGIAIAAAHEALAQEVAYRSQLEVVRAERARLFGALGDLGLHPLPSETNFVYCNEPYASTGGFLLDHGACVRTGDTILSPGHLRLTVATPADNDVLIQLLRDHLTQLRRQEHGQENRQASRRRD